MLEDARNGHLGSLTVHEISALHDQRQLELGGKSDGQLPKDLANPPGFVGTIFDWILKHAPCPQPMFALSASLVALSIIFGRKVRSSVGQYTNIYALNVGQTSAGKGFPLDIVQRILDAAGGDHLWRSKVTSDAAIETALCDHGAVLLTIDEAGHFFRAANARSNQVNPSNSVKPALLELWSAAGKTWKGKQRAKSNGKDPELVSVDHPHVCLYGSAQPEIFFDGVSREDINDGWIPRILFFLTMFRSKPIVRDEVEIPDNIIASFRSWIDRREEVPFVIAMSPAAKAKLETYEDEVYRKISEPDPSVAKLYGKVIENTLRVALVLAVSRHMDEPAKAHIDVEDIDYAYKLVYFLTMTMEDVLKLNLSENFTEKKNKQLLALIKKAGPNGLSTSEITAKTRTLQRTERLRLLDDLVEGGDILTVSLTNGGTRYIAGIYKSCRASGETQPSQTPESKVSI